MSSSVESLVNKEYKYGFVTDIEADEAPMGLSEDIVRLISAKKGEPEWLLDWRLKAYRGWLKMTEPHNWPNIRYSPVDYQALRYYSAPRTKTPLGSLDDVDPKLLETYQKLGIPLTEQKLLAGVAVDAIFDSVSVGTTYKAKLAEAGVIFCSFGEAVREHPELVRKYLGSVVPASDNFFAALNAAVFSDGSFVFVPKGVRCPMELSTYFRINAENTGQFERTLIVAEEGASVSYLEGCTAPKRDENQLHAAVVELVALDDATIKYSTVQNWYAGDAEGKGGIYNFVTKRGKCSGVNSKISWTQVETGSAITWKYPSVILQGDNSVGEFYSVAVVNGKQQADTGTKMIHLGKNTRSTIVSKGISAGQGQNSYRGLVKVLPKAAGARNYTQCDSMLIGNRCGAHTFPYIDVQNSTASVEHEASTSKIGEDQIFYLKQRGLNTENAISMIVNGFCKEVFKELPMEFAVEAPKPDMPDLRKTLRKNLRRGGELLDIIHRRPKRNRLKLVLLCDVSRSMELYSAFLIQFMYAFQQVYRRMETFVFSTSLKRITSLLKQKNFHEAMQHLSNENNGWSGGTRIGESLNAFVNEYGKKLIDSKTIVVILSDGWDTGNIDLIKSNMEFIHAKSKKLIWLNPLAGFEDYKPHVSAMKAALPFIDVFAPVHNVESLKRLGKWL